MIYFLDDFEGNNDTDRVSDPYSVRRRSQADMGYGPPAGSINRRRSM